MKSSKRAFGLFFGL